MYFDHFGFNEAPFTLSPNSHFFFSSAKHTEALSTLIYAINQRKGFVVITGPIGSGKTTVCRTLINQLEANTHVALLTNSHLSGKDLLISIMEDLQIEYTNGSKVRLHAQLNDYLIDQISQDNNIVLIVDEAQNLNPSVLEEIRMLSNLETEQEKLIQIILLGQPELKTKLAQPRLEQLRQRISVYYELKPLTPQESQAYIEHRLKVAGNTDTFHNLFTPEALETLYRFTKGTPRLINQICDNALLTGYVRGVDQIDATIMNEVIGESPMTVLTNE